MPTIAEGTYRITVINTGRVDFIFWDSQEQAAEPVFGFDLSLDDAVVLYRSLGHALSKAGAFGPPPGLLRRVWLSLTGRGGAGVRTVVDEEAEGVDYFFLLTMLWTEDGRGTRTSENSGTMTIRSGATREAALQVARDGVDAERIAKGWEPMPEDAAVVFFSLEPNKLLR